MIATKHYIKRGRERCGLPKSALLRNAEKARLYGVSLMESNGVIKSSFNPYQSQIQAIIYNRYVYYFKEDTVITIVPLKKEYIRYIENIKNIKKEI